MYYKTILYTYIYLKSLSLPLPPPGLLRGKRGGEESFARFMLRIEHSIYRITLPPTSREGFYGVFLLLLHNFTTLSSYLTFPISFIKILIYGIRA